MGGMASARPTSSKVPATAACTTSTSLRSPEAWPRWHRRSAAPRSSAPPPLPPPLPLPAPASASAPASWPASTTGAPRKCSLAQRKRSMASLGRRAAAAAAEGSREEATKR
eukprot:scaffold3422_cov298-Prasinococcus_capsulatus_cf.AAC.6